MSELVSLSFHKILQSPAYTVIILEGADKKFAIYCEPLVGSILQRTLSQESHPRPLTHELISCLLKGLAARLIQVVITDIEDTIYFAKIFIEQEDGGGKKQILEIDARPSDALTLALMHGTPLFCRKEILEKAIDLQE